MSGFAAFVSSAGGWVWETTWQASLLALLVFAVQLAFGRRLTARWRYALWLLVLLRLVLPVLPESRTSIYNWAPERPPIGPVEIALQPDPVAASPVSVEPTSAIQPPVEKPFSAAGFVPWLALLWVIGAGSLVLIGLWRHAAFWRRARRLAEESDEEMMSVFGELKDARFLRQVRLLVTKAVEAPAVGGLFSPTILLPVNIREKLQPEELRMVLLHELAHVKRGDILSAWLFWFLGSVHWFNPILQLAFWRARLDRELACDETVLGQNPERSVYGGALLNLWEGPVRGPRPVVVIGIFERRTEPFRRISHITAYRRPSFWQTVAGLLAVAVIGLGALTGQSRAAAKKERNNPAEGYVTSLIETEFQMITVPNTMVGEVLAQPAGSDLRPAVLGLLGQGAAQVFDVSKLVSRNGARTYTVSQVRVDAEPVLAPDLQTMDLNMSLTNKKSTLTMSAYLPREKAVCLGSFDDPRQGVDATVFVFAQWKILKL